MCMFVWQRMNQCKTDKIFPTGQVCNNKATYFVLMCASSCVPNKHPHLHIPVYVSFQLCTKRTPILVHTNVCVLLVLYQKNTHPCMYMYQCICTSRTCTLAHTSVYVLPVLHQRTPTLACTSVCVILVVYQKNTQYCMYQCMYVNICTPKDWSIVYLHSS